MANKKKTTPIIKTGKKGGQINNKNAEVWTEQAATKILAEYIQWLDDKDMNLFETKFLKERQMNHDLFINLSKKFISFSEALTRAREYQGEKLCTLALTRKVDPYFAKFLLSARFNYKEKQEIEHSLPKTGKIDIVYND